MSPDEIADIQKQQCIFCHIVNDRVASKKVYQDDKFLAVLDINPGNPGHMLVLPKEHYMIMPQIPEIDIGHLGMVSKALSKTALRALKAQGTNVFIANGVVAGQRAQHFIMHLIPRMENDNIGFEVPEMQIKHSSDVKKKLTSAINRAFGLKEIVKVEGEPEEDKAREKPDVDEKESKAAEDSEERLNLDEIANFLTKK